MNFGSDQSHNCEVIDLLFCCHASNAKTVLSNLAVVIILYWLFMVVVIDEDAAVDRSDNNVNT